MPPFALFENVAPGFTYAFRANNAKSGTCVAEERMRARLEEGYAATRELAAALRSVRRSISGGAPTRTGTAPTPTPRDT